MRMALLLAAIGTFAIRCASSNVTTAPPAAKPVLISAAQIDSSQFRRELEDAYSRILDRDRPPSPEVPRVDVQAAASIPIPQHRTIDSAVRLFTVDMKDSIQASLLRSGRYRTLIDRALEEQRLPRGLAYLPVIESAYLPDLTSRAGAHGIWQFMPDTAREYGLRVDWWIDERADPERSTRAAAAYLRDLHQMFGDWSLALAAYNCGPGRVRRTLNEAGATTFWELADRGLLPKETRGYVPTFFATLLIASDPEAYGFVLGEPQDSHERAVEVRGPVSLAWIAEATGAGEDLLQELNPALRRGVVPPGRAVVRVPARTATSLAERADTLYQNDIHLKFCSFRLRRGDTVKRLARALDTKPETIYAMNGLSPDDTPRAGDTLYLPVRARELGSLLAHSENEEFFYAVRRGDTLYSIAKNNGLSVAELRELNDLKKNQSLRVGQKLRVSAPRTLTAGGM